MDMVVLAVQSTGYKVRHGYRATWLHVGRCATSTALQGYGLQGYSYNATDYMATWLHGQMRNLGGDGLQGYSATGLRTTWLHG